MSTVRIQVRRGTSSDWSTANPTLAAGEIGFETNTKKVKVGDGSTAWNSLGYISSDSAAIGEIAMDAIYAALTPGSGISKSYNDGADTITINNTGVISFNTRTGSVTLSDTDVNNALGYTAADNTDLSALSQTVNQLDQDIQDEATARGLAIAAEELARDTAISTHNSDTINVHGIANTSDLATESYADQAAADAAAVV